MTEKESEKIGSQRYSDMCLFYQWCENFFDISSLIEDESQLDSHHCRWFFIALWELFECGTQYIENEMSLPQNYDCDYLHNALTHIEKIKSLYSDTDYFMLQYYRHSASHIFQHNYSWLDKNGILNPDDRKFSFQDKIGSKYHLTNLQIREKVISVLGEYGYGESSYRRQLISRAYEAIKEWALSQRKIVASLNFKDMINFVEPHGIYEMPI